MTMVPGWKKGKKAISYTNLQKNQVSLLANYYDIFKKNKIDSPGMIKSGTL